VHPWVADVFRASPRVDRVLLYDKKGRHKGLVGMLRLAGELRQEQFDCVILLQNAFEAALIAVAAGIPVRGGYSTDVRGLLLNHAVPKNPAIKGQHEIHYYQEMVRGLGVQPATDALELFVPEQQREAARRRIVQMIGTRQTRPCLIGFNPGAAFGPAKRWPVEKFARLAQLLCQQTDAHILLFGAAADQETTAEVRVRAGVAAARMHDCAGKTSLMEAMALIGECDAFVTNDSGLMHVAAALRTPIVAIFGSTDHIATGPLSDTATIIRVALPCSPCKKSMCPKKHFACMQQIESEAVYSALLQLLKGAA
jgi:heptosyltransferase-2